MASSTNGVGVTFTETYDRYGNRSAQTAVSGCVAPMTCPQPSVTISATTNRLVGPPYSYDSSGNMTNDGINTLVYDAENRVVSATNGSSSGAYVYDGNGLRVHKCVPNCTSPTLTQVFVYSGSVELAEYDNGVTPANPTNEYVNAGSQKIALISGGATVYFHNDHLSPRMRTTSSGSVEDSAAPSPLERPGTSPRLARHSSSPPTIATPNPAMITHRLATTSVAWLGSPLPIRSLAAPPIPNP
jgi:YD repeat-containing protein